MQELLTADVQMVKELNGMSSIKTVYYLGLIVMGFTIVIIIATVHIGSIRHNSSPKHFTWEGILAELEKHATTFYTW